MSTVQATCRIPIQNPPAETVSERLFNAGLAMSVITGFMEAVASDPDAPAQPLTERIVDTIFKFSFGVLAVSSVPALTVVGAVAFVGEKVFDTFDALFTMSHHVEQFGNSLEIQREIIDKFGPMLEISEATIKKLITLANEKKVQWETSTGKLCDLEKNYPAHAGLVAIVNDRITFLEAVLPGLISQNRITILGQSALETRVDLVNQIAREEQEAKELMHELSQLTASVSEMVGKLEHLEVKTSASAHAKGELITALQEDVQSLIEHQALVSKTMSRPSNVSTNIVIV